MSVIINKTKLTYKLLMGTGLSILTFLSLSFITVLLQLNSPIHRQIDCSLNIGFPYIYYKQYIIDLPIPNSAWAFDNLIIDIILTWIIITSLYFIMARKR
jgi:hypothetical protein